MEGDVYLEFPDERGAIRPLRFRDPIEILVAREPEQVRPALREIERAVDAGRHAAGFLSYEAAPAFDPAMAVAAGARMPLLWFGIYEQAEPIDLDQIGSDGRFELSTWRPTVERATYDEAIATVRAAIARGESYQVNYTMRLRADFTGDDLALFRRLRRAQRAQYGAYVNAGRYRIVSASPELFFRRDGDRLTARPMKGTLRRGRWPAEDVAHGAALARSEKNRAENVMIVDLLRNDLGRVARTGSVTVPRLFDIERYPTLFQMTSTVEATAREGLTLEGLLGALFPCGSITGAPKISTMGLIAELERTPREIYCGAIGHLAPGGDARFSVAIRTVWIDTETGRAEYGTGGGITWDSTPGDEYEEALVKAALLTARPRDFDLLETMRAEDGRIALLDRHLDRLAASAEYFDRDLDVSRIRALLEAAAHEAGEAGARLRLTVDPDGGPRLESAALPAPNPAPVSVALAEMPVDRHDPMLFHKTTDRGRYVAARAAHPGAFDVLLWNHKGELTEFTIGNLVADLDGARWTPPLEVGLLPGVMRAELLTRGEIAERVLTREDLAHAERLWLINSVRGWVEVRLDGESG